MSSSKDNDVARLMREGTRIQAAMEEAVYDTLREHKLLGFPVAIWRDGKAVWLPPEEIVLPEQKNGAAE